MTSSALPVKEQRIHDKRTTGPRFTQPELDLVQRAAAAEDRPVSYLLRVAAIQYARDILAREGPPVR